MLNKNKWIRLLAGGMLVAVMALGVVTAFAQTQEDPTPTPSAPTTAESDSADSPTTDALPAHSGRGHGLHVDSAALAEALGITEEELTAAQEEARAAAIAQAVTDGLLTQEQADELLANGSSGRGSHFGSDQNSYLADALGITVEELEAARLEVYTAQLAEMVAAGTITQEEADLILAQKAVQNYVDDEAYQSAVQSIYAEAVAQALADGVITQAQADELLANMSAQTFHFPGAGGHGGPGGHGGGHHGHGGPDGDWSAPSDSGTTDDATSTGDNA